MAEQLIFGLYARKSSRAEDKQVHSIEDQITEMRNVRDKNGLIVAETIQDKQSAKATGRPGFNELIRHIESNRINAILTWKLDRLARNFDDGGKLISLLQQGKIRQIVTYEKTYLPTDNVLMIAMELGLANQYVRDLSVNTKRGVRKKVDRGEFPHVAPFGYLNDTRIKRIIIDRERGPIVRELFERYATGDETLDSLRLRLQKIGFVSRTGKLCGRHFVSRLLTNPIYYGHFKHGGVVHAGIHEPLISKALYDRVQMVMVERWRFPTNTTAEAKAYLRLMRCYECGSAITAEVQKGHVYYRCTRKNKMRHCRQPYVREEALDHEISCLLARYSIPSALADQMMERVAVESAESIRLAAAAAQEKATEIDAINGRLGKLQDAFLDGVIERDAFVPEKARLLSRRKTLEEQKTILLTKGVSAWLEPLKKWISTAQSLGEIATRGSMKQKNTIAKEIFGSNLYLDAKKPSGRATKPWSYLAVNELTTVSVQSFDLVRTHFVGDVRDGGALGAPPDRGDGHEAEKRAPDRV